MNALDETPTLLLSHLRSALAAAPDLPLTVVWPDGEPIEAHFHVTEVGRVRKDFVDCGGTIRSLETCLLQTWVGDDTDHRITGAKLLRALLHAEPILGGDDLPVELEYEACNVVQLRLVSTAPEAGALMIQLASKHTDCLAKDLCVPAVGKPAAEMSACGSGCC
jgi:hypothetical protein